MSDVSRTPGQFGQWLRRLYDIASFDRNTIISAFPEMLIHIFSKIRPGHSHPSRIHERGHNNGQALKDCLQTLPESGLR
ncbi:hypothetical protein AA21952_0211 [Acetobacter oeni LMG 21952]|nr:hypothetical protein AA21952_0211 [Acetobacter oeni LMG 21952]